MSVLGISVLGFQAMSNNQQGEEAVRQGSISSTASPSTKIDVFIRLPETLEEAEEKVEEAYRKRKEEEGEDHLKF